MHAARYAVVILSAVIIPASSGWAQDSPDAIQAVLRVGDMLTVTTTGRSMSGRFVGDRDDMMVLSTDGTETRLRWSDIERVQRRRNGILLGAIIGAGAGLAAGIPLAFTQNETGEATTEVIKMIAIGFGAGIGVDALLSVNRTVYERPAVPKIEALARSGGGGVRLTFTW